MIEMTKFKNLNGILLVDDDLAINFIHTRVIQKTDINVAVKAVTNVEAAIEFLTGKGQYENSPDTFRPGIIFLDINMPGLTGWDFMEEYHKIDEHQKAQVVVVMLTTSLNPADEERAKKDELISTFLHKPLRPETLMELAAKYFEEIG